MALIEREVLKATLKRVKWLSAADGSAAVHLVNVAPAVDAPPVVHGRWDKDCTEEGRVIVYFCSVCGTSLDSHPRMSYCPNCGARMDGGEGDG